MLKLDKIVLFIYVSFALDSLLKINAGVQLHLGIIAILLTNALVLLKKPYLAISPLTKNYMFVLFVLYCAINGFSYNHQGYAGLLVYLFIVCNLIIFCSYTVSHINKRALVYFQLVMIVTGLLQYGLFKFFGYQISFIDAEHYQKGSSVSHRLRGFFVEPNWFAIAFTFNTVLLIGTNIERFCRQMPWLTGLTIIVIVLNGTLATLGALLIIYSVPYVKKSPLKGMFIIAVLAAILVATFSFREGIKLDQAGASAAYGNTQVLNHSSRVEPIIRVLDFQSRQDFTQVFFGHGLGSWATIAVPNQLSVLVFVPKPGVRDGSEIPVILFELGILGALILILDLIITFIKCPARNYHYRGALILFFICLALYPTLKFWMYMPYYFYIRAFIYQNQKNSNVNNYSELKDEHKKELL